MLLYGAQATQNASSSCKKSLQFLPRKCLIHFSDIEHGDDPDDRLPAQSLVHVGRVEVDGKGLAVVAALHYLPDAVVEAERASSMRGQLGEGAFANATLVRARKTKVRSKKFYTLS